MASRGVKAARKEGMSDADANVAMKGEMSSLEKACKEKTGSRCDVVTLYAGGKYNLYSYTKYTDVRLVFAPEADIAFFGGDPDNFNYPRFDLDMALFRVYEGDKALSPTAAAQIDAALRTFGKTLAAYQGGGAEADQAAMLSRALLSDDASARQALAAPRSGAVEALPPGMPIGGEDCWFCAPSAGL